jgi:hypothetical protein
LKSRNIYFLNWNDNKCFISDLPEKDALISFLEEERLKGYYGTSPGAEDMHSFQTICKVKIEIAVQSWFNDKKFLLHFVVAVGIFLLSFYFFSYVIRDPLPLVDEIILSLILAVLGWHRLSNQEVHSEKALLKKQELIEAMNRIPFENADYLKQIELYLEKLSAMKPDDLESLEKEKTTPLFFNSYSREMTDFRKALDRYLKEGRSGIFSLFKRKQSEKKDVKPQELYFLYNQLSDYLLNRP